MEIYKKSEELDRTDIGRITKTRNAIERTADKVKFVSTHSKNSEYQSTLFWMLMPSNYVVFYNLGLGEEFNDRKCGSFYVQGKSFRDFPNEPSFKSKGWIHMENEKYDEIEKEYINLKKQEVWEEIDVSPLVKEKELS